MQLRTDPCREDLRAFHVARQLHLLSQLRAVFTTNDMSYPLFYICLDPRAKAAAQHTLLCLRRWFCRRLGVRSADAHPLLSILTGSILSYLSFPEFASPERLPARSLYVQLGVQALTAAYTAVSAAAASEDNAGGTPLRETPRATAAAAAPPPSLVAPTDSRAVVTPPATPGRAESVASPATATGTASPASTLQTPARTATAAEQLVEVWERSLIYRPMFFVRPHVRLGTSTAASGPGASESRPHDLYVRMAHTDFLNEESLNPYFGRYGQVSCELLLRVQMTTCAYINEETAYALTEMFRCAPEEIYLQDFIVSTDSPQNAERAVRSAYYKELLFIAFHESLEEESVARRQRPRAGTPLACHADGNNCFAIADADALMAETAAVCHLVPSTAAIMLAAATAAARGGDDTGGAGAVVPATLAGRRRARRAERQRRRRLRREIRQQRSEGSDDGSDSRTTTSSTASSSDGAGGGGGDSGGGVLAGYVPDVIIDGLPYWLTEDQLMVLLQGYGTVAELRLSIDDLTGAFAGAVLVRMSSVEEAVLVSDGLHGMIFKGFPLRAGVLNEHLQIESLVSGEVRWPVPLPGEMSMAPPPKIRVTINDRMWV